MKWFFERVLMAELTKGAGDERFGLGPRSRDALGRALLKDLTGQAPLAAVQAALRFAAAFDGKLRSPSVAAAIRAVLKADPDAVALIRRSRAKATPSSVSETRRFLRAEGRVAPVRAPSLGAEAPANTIPLRAMIDPGRSRIGTGAAKKPAGG